MYPSVFLEWDLESKYSRSIAKLFDGGSIRLLAGCAPCQPFSKLTQKIKQHRDFDMLDTFPKFIRGVVPELVVMENVTVASCH